LDRTAVIYVRQSTLAQVREHTESTMRQYALAEEATRLGWAADAVEVIDADLGVSGRSVEGRDGFKALVARVCLGEIGAVFGLEISRLARSSADLSRMLELARLTDTLVIDADGIYDLADFNDRLLLGLKGTMSEAELHLLAGRLQGAKRAAADSKLPDHAAISAARTASSGSFGMTAATLAYTSAAAFSSFRHVNTSASCLSALGS
jgi:DNA invertase Pin-like site-specific DNA recombinase